MTDINEKFKKLDREISTNYFDACVKKVLNFLIMENKNIVDFFEDKFGRSLLSREIVDLPLITVSGGEMINMYSDVDSIMPTKDLDCKIVLPGIYSLPYDSLWLSLANDNSIVQKANELLKTYYRPDDKVNIDKLMFLSLKSLMNIEIYFENKSICNYDSWLRYMNDFGYNNINYLKNIMKNYVDLESGNVYSFIIYDKITQSRNNFIKNILKDFRKNFVKDNYFYSKNNKLLSIEHLNILLNEGLNSFIPIIENIDNNYFQELDEHIVIPITVMIPKLNKKSRFDKFLNFPFTLNQPIMGRNEEGFKIYKDVFFKNNLGDIESFKILLRDLNNQISEWFDLTEQQEDFILDSFMPHFDLFYVKWGLSSIFNTKFYVIFNKNTPNDWSISINSEGFVDVWSEYYTQYSETKAKRFYEYKLPTGDLPCIVEKINIDKKISYLKIPSIFWAIKDQTGMLVLSLRKERVPPNGGWTEDSAQFIPNDQDPLKYCKKIKSLLKGLWLLINNVKNDIKNGNTDKYNDFLKKCKDEIGFDIIECGADGYISYLFKNSNDYWKRVGYDKYADNNIQNTLNNSILPNIEIEDIDDQLDNISMFDYIKTIDQMDPNKPYVAESSYDNVKNLEKNMSDLFGIAPVSDMITNDYISADLPKYRLEVITPQIETEVFPTKKYIRTSFRNIKFEDDKKFLKKIKEKQPVKSLKKELTSPPLQFTMKRGIKDLEDLFKTNEKIKYMNAFTDYSEFK